MNVPSVPSRLSRLLARELLYRPLLPLPLAFSISLSHSNAADLTALSSARPISLSRRQRATKHSTDDPASAIPDADEKISPPSSVPAHLPLLTLTSPCQHHHRLRLQAPQQQQGRRRLLRRPPPRLLPPSAFAQFPNRWMQSAESFGAVAISSLLVYKDALEYLLFLP